MYNSIHCRALLIFTVRYLLFVHFPFCIFYAVDVSCASFIFDFFHDISKSRKVNKINYYCHEYWLLDVDYLDVALSYF